MENALIEIMADADTKLDFMDIFESFHVVHKTNPLII